MATKKNQSVRVRNGLRRAAFETLESRQLLSASLSFNPLPFGTNQLVPCAQYDTGGANVSYHDTTPTDLGNDPTYRPGSAVDVSTGGTTGQIVTFTAAGEYMNYTMVVPTTGMYAVQTSASNTANGALYDFAFNGANMTGEFSVEDTGNYSKFATQQSGAFSLTAGTYKVSLVIDTVATNGAGGNQNWFALIPVPATPTTAEAPYSTPFTVGQSIPFVNYDKGGQGVGFNDSTSLNQGNSSFRNNTSVDISSGGTSGNIVGFTTAGEWLKYTVKIATTGTYSIVSSVANPDSGATFHVADAGVNLTGSIPVAATASYTTYGTDTSTTFKLTAGTQTLQVFFDKAAANAAVGNFDFFKVVPTTPASEVPFTTAFTANQTIPATNYDKGGEGVGYHDTTPTDLGNDATYRPGDAVDVSKGGSTGQVVGFIAPTEYLNYSLNIATAGQYELVANTANTAAGGSFHAEVGGLNLTGAMAVANSGSYTTYTKETSIPFTLAAGKQVLHVVFDKNATNGAVGNFDYFKLVPFTPLPDTPFKTAFVPNEVIPAANYDKGGQNVSYHVLNTTNLGTDNYRPGDLVSLKTGGTTGNLVAYTTAGEWLQYTVTIATAGNYKFEASIANPASGGTFHVLEGTTNLTGAIAITPTTSFTTFSTDTSGSFKLAAGTQIIRVFMDTTATNGAVGNFDWFKIVPA